MQIPQSRRRYPRLSQFHMNTRGCIRHPSRQLQDNTWSCLDKEEVTCGMLFAVLHRQTSAMQRMPAVVDLNVLPDMGRMNGRRRSGRGTGCTSVIQGGLALGGHLLDRRNVLMPSSALGCSCRAPNYAEPSRSSVYFPEVCHRLTRHSLMTSPAHPCEGGVMSTATFIAKLRGTALLGAGILRVNGWARRRGDSAVHPQPGA